jgi:hypothetical protein
MHGTILVYGNEPMLVTTRGLILEKAGYKVFTAQAFGNAMSLQPEIKCAVLDFAESEVAIEGVDLIRGLVGPSTLVTDASSN